MTITTGRIWPVVLSVTASSRVVPARVWASVIANSTAATASFWFAVGEMCQPNSYLDQ